MTGRKLGLRKRIGLRLFSDLYAEKIAEHKLRTLFWECTLRCNLACRHCGSDCRVDPGVPDMPLADFLKVLDEEVTPHNRPEDVLLIFSGGEVLVRSDLEEAGREVTRRGYAWGMVTNGLALDADRLRSLMDAGLRSISISFDGFEDAHNYIRRNPRSFGKALDAIRLIVREPRLTYDVITCVTSPMVARLEEFKELLIAEGVKYWRIFSIFPVGRAGVAERHHRYRLDLFRVEAQQPGAGFHVEAGHLMQLHSHRGGLQGDRDVRGAHVVHPVPVIDIRSREILVSAGNQ